MDQERIGAFLRSVRKENGLTQEQLAERLGVSQRSVSRWETGKTMPDYALLPGLCEALGINVAELLGGERIAGDSVPKKQVTAAAHSLIALMNTRRRRLIGAVLAAVLTLACMAGLYGLEFHVSVESTADLERAIDAYHHVQGEVSSDILERQAVGNRLFVLYGEREFPGACGLACLERGAFGGYRILSCDDSDSRWLHVRKVTVGRKAYCVAYGAGALSGIDEYGVCGVREGDGQTIEDAPLLYRLDYPGTSFLRFTALDEGVTLSPFRIRYYQAGAELPEDALERVLGPHFAEGAPSSGTGTAETWLIYALEGIVLLLGVVFVRYFLRGD